MCTGLGIFGYLGAHELRARTPDGSTGNFGQADQRQAMKWVRQNIHAFGGDKDRVLIAGQSSGSGSGVCIAPSSCTVSIGRLDKV